MLWDRSDRLATRADLEGRLLGDQLGNLADSNGLTLHRALVQSQTHTRITGDLFSPGHAA